MAAIQRIQGKSGYRHFPAVDGLRGIAILSVLLYHTNWFANGLFGVDAFFVLSGFLVTLLMLREVAKTGRIAVGRFYLKRYKRLMPGLMVILALVVAFTYLLGSLQQARSIGEQAAPALFQVANWAQISRDQAYWDQFGQIQPLGAMWSLSITEQFYVVWPLVLMVLCWALRRRFGAITAAVLVLFAGSAAVAPLLFDGNNSDTLYLATHTRVVGFMAGAASACVVHQVYQRRARHAEPSSVAATRVRTALLTVVGTGCLVAVVAISVAISTYHEPWLYHGGLAIVATLVAVLTATLCQDRGPLVRVLSYRPLAEVGQMSYSMYLLHLPIFWLLQQAEPEIEPYALFVVGGGLTWLASLFLHYGLTERLRRRDWNVVRAVPVSGITVAVIVASAHYLPISIEQQMHRDGKPLVLTLGDSLANDLATGLAEHGKRYGVVDGGLAGCGVMSPDKTKDRVGLEVKNWDKCRGWPQRWRDVISDNEPDAMVVHLGWDAVLQQVDGHWESPCDAAYRTRYTKQLDTAMGIWRQAAKKAPVLLMTERTETGAGRAEWGNCYNDVVTDYVKKAQRDPGSPVRVLDLDRFLCSGLKDASDGKKCTQYTPDGKQLYPTGDGVHFTDAGMDYVTPWLERKLATELRPAAKRS